MMKRGQTGLNNWEGRWGLGNFMTDKPRFPRQGRGRGPSST